MLSKSDYISAVQSKSENPFFGGVIQLRNCRVVYYSPRFCNPATASTTEADLIDDDAPSRPQNTVFYLLTHAPQCAPAGKE